MRRPLVAGNWKMYTDPLSAGELAGKLRAALSGCNWADLAVFPPFTSLANIIPLLANSNIAVGGQNIHWEKEGAFTGEISPVILKNIGCRMVLIGHSERRTYFGETEARVLLKVKAALAVNLIPIVCIGESLEQRESGITEQVVANQLQGGLSEIDDISKTVIAYEPVWAIGTGRNATPEQASDIHRFIRKVILDRWGSQTAESMQILYGGSVKPDNAKSLAVKEDIDGFLVGGASLKVDSFSAIAESFK